MIKIWALLVATIFAIAALLAVVAYLRPFETRSTIAPSAPVTAGAAIGQIAPIGQPLAATPTPRAAFYRVDPYGPVKIEAGAVHRLGLGRLETGTQVRAVITVAFNNRLSNLSGVPDVDLAVVGPGGMVTSQAQARNGHQLTFQAPSAGDYVIELSNARSRINAKQVGLQFLQP